MKQQMAYFHLAADELGEELEGAAVYPSSYALHRLNQSPAVHHLCIIIFSKQLGTTWNLELGVGELGNVEVLIFFVLWALSVGDGTVNNARYSSLTTWIVDQRSGLAACMEEPIRLCRQ
eukprot:scaffold20941_cov143-Skeletonema_marinoi.AAC.11